jgi:hypothetical protein
MSINSYPESKTKSPSPRHLLLMGCVLFLFGAVLYGLTVQNGVAWQDSGTYQWRVVNGDYRGNFGLASAHPLYIAVGRLFVLSPLGDPTTRLNMLSVVSMSLALAVLGVMTARITSTLWIGFFTALIFSQMHTVWWLATIAESYPLYAVFFMVELWIFIEFLKTSNARLAVTLFLVNGLSLNVHNFALVALLIYSGALSFLVLKKDISIKYLFLSMMAFVFGASIYLYLIFDLAQKEGIVFAVSSALFGEFSDAVLNVKTLWPFLKVNAALASLNFVSMVLLFAVVGWVSMRRKLGDLCTFFLGGMTLLQFIFVVRYAVPDQFMFLLPSLIMIMLAASVGMKTLSECYNKKFVVFAATVSCIIPFIVYFNFLSILSFFEVKVNRETTRPFREEIRYWAMPWKHNEFSAERFAREALQKAAPDGLILSDGTSYYPLLLVQERYHYPIGVTIQLYSDFVEPDCIVSAYRSKLTSAEVYAVSPNTSFFPECVREHIHLERIEGAVLYRVVWNENDPQFN